MATPIIDLFDDLYIDHDHDLDHDEFALILQREVNALDESLDALIPRLNSTATLSSSRRSGPASPSSTAARPAVAAATITFSYERNNRDNLDVLCENYLFHKHRTNKDSINYKCTHAVKSSCLATLTIGGGELQWPHSTFINYLSLSIT